MKAEIDAVLRGAVERGEVPGIAATAGNAAGTLYEGAFGRARPGPAGGDDAGHGGLDRLDDQGDHQRPRRCSRSRPGGSRSMRPIGEVLPELARRRCW